MRCLMWPIILVLLSMSASYINAKPKEIKVSNEKLEIRILEDSIKCSIDDTLFLNLEFISRIESLVIPINIIYIELIKETEYVIYIPLYASVVDTLNKSEFIDLEKDSVYVFNINFVPAEDIDQPGNIGCCRCRAYFNEIVELEERRINYDVASNNTLTLCIGK